MIFTPFLLSLAQNTSLFSFSFESDCFKKVLLILQLGSKHLCCSGANVMCTSPFTRRIMDKTGFAEYKELRWDQYREEDGGPLTFPNIEYESCSFMYKRFS